MIARMNQVAPSRDEYDAIVVGSGIAGGWAAKELCEKGLKVLVLERGSALVHGEYPHEFDQPWQLDHRGRGDPERYDAEYPIQSLCYAFGEATEHLFVNDKEHPYLNPPDKPFRWIRGYHLGGRSLMWGRQCYRWSDIDFEANARDGHGVELKTSLREPGPWTMWLGAWGEHLPRHENYVALDPEQVDPWGIPLLRIHCAWTDNERRMMDDAANQAAEMLEAAGCVDVAPFNNLTSPGFCIHEMGTARMGRDAKTSVLNAHNQAHDVPNLFVTDGACMASSACQNPSVTYMALTARAVDYAVEELKRQNL